MRKNIGSNLCKLSISMLLITSLFMSHTTNANAESGKQEETKVGNNLVEKNETKTKWDTTKPVIESLEMPDNKKTVEVGTKVPVYVKAYDVDSGIKSVTIMVSYKDANGKEWVNNHFELTYNSKTKCYEGNLNAPDGGYILASITSVEVVDQKGNYAIKNYSHFDDKTYEFSIKGSVEQRYSVKRIEFDKNQKTIQYDDEIDLKVFFDVGISGLGRELSVEFSREGSSETKTLSLAWNGYSSNETETVYSLDGTHNLKEFPEGKWVLSSCDAYLESGKLTLGYPNKDQVWFQIEGEYDNISPEIISIEMDKKGEVVKSGDEIEIKIKAKDNVALDYENSYLYMNSVADIDMSERSDMVQLTYDKETDMFVGTFVIDDDTYPSEWVLSGIAIYDQTSNCISFEDSIENQNEPYYVIVQKDGSYVNPTLDIKRSFYVINDNGSYEEVSSFEKTGVERRTTLKELGVEFPDGKTNYKGLNFVGWIDGKGNPIDENTVLLNYYQKKQYYAKYDKLPVGVSFRYPNDKHELLYDDQIFLVPYGTTYKELFALATKNASFDVYQGEGFDGWEFSEWSLAFDETMDSEVPCPALSSIVLEASYLDRMPFVKYYSYLGVNGEEESVAKITFLDKGTTYEEVLSQIEKEEAPASFTGLRFNKWDIRSSDTGEISNPYDSFYLEAKYENCVVKFFVDDRYKEQQKTRGAGAGVGTELPDLETKKLVVAEVGEMIDVPEFEEYKSIVWLSDIKPIDGKVEAKENLVLYGYGIKADKPSEPETPEVKPDTKPEEKPETPETPNTPEETPKPETPILPPTETVDGVMDETQIKTTIEKIQNSKSEEVIRVSMEKANVISKDILASAKGKDVTIVLDMDGYSWSINGKDILATDLKDINLEVSFDQNRIPSDTVKKLAGNNPIKQLSLTHNGNFGFKANLTFHMGSEYTGKYGNLYYYDSDGKMVFMNAGKVAEDGNVSLSFSHASEYVIVINEKSGQEVTKDDPMKDTGSAPQTNAYVFVVLLLTGACFILHKKENKSQSES